MNNFLVAYDIFDIKRLPKVRKAAYSFSLGGQRSALEAPLNKALMRELVSELLEIIEDEDKVNIIKFVDEPILLGRAKHIDYEKEGIIII